MSETPEIIPGAGSVTRDMMQRVHTHDQYGLDEPTEPVPRSAVDTDPIIEKSLRGTGRMIIEFTEDGVKTTIKSTEIAV